MSQTKSVLKTSQVSGTTSKMPGTTSKVSGTASKTPGTTSKVSGTASKTPGTTNKVSGTTNKIPGNTNKGPESADKEFETLDKRFGTASKVSEETASKLSGASKVSGTTVMSKSTTELGAPTVGYWPSCLAPGFRDVPCLKAGQPSLMDLQELRGKLVLLLFYPVDFGYIGPTELELLDELGADCEVVAISSGSLLSKQAFLNTPRSEGGGQGLGLSLVEDRGGRIARAYGITREGSGYSFRGAVLVDSDGEITARLVSDLPMGLGIREAIRLVQQEASQARGEVEGDEVALEEDTPEEGMEGEEEIGQDEEEEMGQDEEEVSSETGHK